MNEPGAALPQDRIEALKEAHNRGIRTWAVLEPVLDPQQSLHLIELTYPFVSYYIVGKLNHFPKEKRRLIGRNLERDTEALLQSRGRMLDLGYSLKHELREAK